ncbi:MAG: peptidyl-tRNA hydrolase Pth2 [Candidatus Thermoplasmatota archaeon]|nr:peptidyl-tRNA hydrolase Pth2 [Candidatus Thermoplasmatota archaeon]
MLSRNDVDFQYKLVVAVRTDLKLSAGKTAVQVAHAAVSCAVQCLQKEKKKFSSWMDEGQRKIVVRVKNLEELHSLREEARRNGLITSLIADAGLTEIPAGTVTCVGIGPAENQEIDIVTGHLPLL